MIFSRLRDRALDPATADSDAVLCGGDTRSWADLNRNITSVANWVRLTVPAESDGAVLVRVPNVISAPEILLGAILSGRTVVPVNPRVPAAAVGQIAARTGAVAAIGTVSDMPADSPLALLDVDSADYARVLSSPVALDVYATAPSLRLIWMTSGTSGAPKPVFADTETLCGMVCDVGDVYTTGPLDTWMAAAPITHSGGFSTAIGALLAGSRLSLLPAWSPVAFAEQVDAHDVTGTMLVPTMIASLLGLPAETKALLNRRLGTVVTAAAPLPPSTRAAFRTFFPEVLFGETFGCTEGGAVSHHWFNGTDLDDTAGYPWPGATVEVRDLETGAALRSGELGVIYVDSPSSANSAREDDGFVRTGDLGVLDDQGRLTLHGRADEVILSGGYNVYPQPIENLLRSFPGVRDAAVVGRDDETYGQVPVAYLVSDGTADLALDVDHGVIHAYLAERVASYALPRRYEIVEAIPTSPVGKTLKKEIPA